MHKHADCLYGKYAAPGIEPLGGCFLFDYSRVAFWGLNIKQISFLCSSGYCSDHAARVSAFWGLNIKQISFLCSSGYCSDHAARVSAFQVIASESQSQSCRESSPACMHKVCGVQLGTLQILALQPRKGSVILQLTAHHVCRSRRS